ncbi:MAG TPA: C40 family peptidase [Chitinophagales bacterium]|nr:C40 family peptidase [Chitinophagales bacterium]
MGKSSKLLSFGKISFIAFAIFAIIYLAFGKEQKYLPEDISNEKEEQIIAQEEPIIIQYNTLRDSIVDFGLNLLGTPYVAAGCSVDGFDCSGFVYFVFQHFEINVPRSSADFENFGEEIPVEDVQKGDLLLFLSPTRNVIGHIGIVSNPQGLKSDFVHASSGREMEVMISSLASEGYKKRFVKAVRVVEE